MELFADDGRANLGPLWEVIADGRPWPELAPHLDHPRTRHLAAHSRVLQGEDLGWDPSLDPALLGVPFALQPWEAEQWDILLDVPGYTRDSGGGVTVAAFPDDFADPEAEVATEELPSARPRQAGHDALPLLAGLSSWVRAYAFHGTSWEAASAVASERAVRRGAVFPFSRAYRCLVHLAAGSSAYGRTSGQAAGRVAAWRALTAMAGGIGPAVPRALPRSSAVCTASGGRSPTTGFGACTLPSRTRNRASVGCCRGRIGTDGTGLGLPAWAVARCAG